MPDTDTTPRPIKPGVSPPASWKLAMWAKTVNDAFRGQGACYLVGSALYGKQWRDVDVRLILEDEHFDALFGTAHIKYWSTLRHQTFCLAFATWGREATGLPIDFQIDRQTDANAMHKGKPRSALGIHLKWDEPGMAE